MSVRLFLWLRRGFDLVCTIAGLGLIVFLGPWMLLSKNTAHVPEAHELIRVNAITTGCRQVLGGVKLLLEGYESEFQPQLDSCIQAQVDLARSAHVALNVMPEDLRTARLRVPIRSFGFEVEGRVVHTIDSDLQTARLDRATVTVTGVIGSVMLIWLGWAVGTNRAALVRLLIGDPAGDAG